MTDHVLELSAIVPKRACILIKTESEPEGHLWEMRRRSELSLKQLKTIEVRGEQALELYGDDGDIATPADAEQLDNFIAEIMGIIFVTVPDEETMSTLTPEQRMEIIQAFTQVCREQREAAQSLTVRQTKAKK